MTTRKQCQFWDCNETIRRNYFLCTAHYSAYEAGKINQCPSQSCGRYKDAEYEVCLICRRQTTNQPDPSPSNEPKRDDRVFQPDDEADEFFVYVLTLDGGEYYVGQTGEIHERLHEHRNDMSQSTKGRNPKFVWFTTVSTRQDAADLEHQLQQLNSKASSRRQITRMVVQFKRLIDEMN